MFERSYVGTCETLGIYISIIKQLMVTPYIAAIQSKFIVYKTVAIKFKSY